MSTLNQLSAKLNHDICALELKQANEYKLLQAQLYITLSDLKPVNLIKGAISQVITSPSVKNEIIDYVKDSSLRYVIKKCAETDSKNSIVNVATTLLGFGLKLLVEKKSEENE